MRYLHLIPGLRVGGAETHLSRLLADWPEPDLRHDVVSLLPDVPLAPRFAAAGVTVQALDFAGMGRAVSAVRALRGLVRAADPDLIVGWMYHGNLAALAARRWAGRSPGVAWNIRATPDGALGWRSAWALRAGAWTSRWPDSIAYNAETSRAQHRGLGYDDRRAAVLPNGVDTERLRPSPAARAELRRRLNIPDDALLIGRIGRYHPMKGYPDFIRMSAAVARRCPRAHFVMAGTGVNRENPELAALPALRELGGRAHLLGELADVRPVMAGLDLMVSSSVTTEAFPNVLAEAMACGVPCVATDVGDSARIVGETGVVVLPGAGGPIADAVAALLEDEPRRAHLGAAARSRVERHFSLDAARAAFAELWRRSMRRGG